MSSRFRPSRYGHLQEFLVEEHFSVHHVADRLREQGRGVVLHKNPGNTGADQLDCLALVDDCSHHRSEEHTSELQSQSNLVCRLLLEKKKTQSTVTHCSCRVSCFKYNILTSSCHYFFSSRICCCFSTLL